MTYNGKDASEDHFGNFSDIMFGRVIKILKHVALSIWLMAENPPLPTCTFFTSNLQLSDLHFFRR